MKGSVLVWCSRQRSSSVYVTARPFVEDGRRRLGCLQTAGYSKWESVGKRGWGVYWGRGKGKGIEGFA